VQGIDAVLIATPITGTPTSPSPPVKSGKDVYCEKPLTHNIREAVELVKAVRRADRVFQTGSQQRSSKEFRVACELVRNGVLGRVAAINVSFLWRSRQTLCFARGTDGARSRLEPVVRPGSASGLQLRAVAAGRT
jgi:predicted dehydrogenase